MMTANTHQQSPKVLVVDDTPENLSILTTFLSQAGFQVFIAQNGREGLQVANSVCPDLILLDVVMPEMDGYTMCQQLKSNAQTYHIPVLFLSAMVNTKDKLKGFQAGAADYITKPFQQEEVLARVNVHLQIAKLQSELNTQNNHLQTEIAYHKSMKSALQNTADALREQTIELREANKNLQALSKLDGLTQIPNRRHFDEYLHHEWRRSQRDNSPLSLLLCDIDHFKDFNDNYGHQAGDTCLQQVAQVIKRAVKRPADLAARYGGEEFTLVLPNTPLEGALHVAQHLRYEVQALRINHAQSPHTYVTISIGVCSCLPNSDDYPEQAINTADQALYEAKARGRNRVVMRSFASQPQHPFMLKQANAMAI